MHHDEHHSGVWRRASAVTVAVGIALLAAACGGSSSNSSSGSSQAGGSTTYQQMLAYAQCVRAHGVPNFPDPNSNGVIGIRNHSVDLQSAQVQAAQKACRHLAPNGGQPPSQAQRARAVSQMLKFARCMRSHGVPKFPDPNSNGAIRIDGGSVNATSPQFKSAQRACQSLSPAGPGRP